MTLFSLSSYAGSLPERINLFLSSFDVKTATSYDIRNIQADYPIRLLMPEMMLPQTSEYPLRDIQVLYKLAQTCTGKLPLSPTVTEPLVFVRAICNGAKLTSRWFSRSSLIHPGGGSYAKRYVDKYPEQFEALQEYMHIKERPKAKVDTLLRQLQNMDETAINALISNSAIFISKNKLWLKKSNKYYIFDHENWTENAKKAGVELTLISDDPSCFVQRGNICWETKDHSDLSKYAVIGLIILNLLLILNWLIYRWRSKRREIRNRMLVIQILTHELRTPIASLSLTVEGFRRKFESLPDVVYGEFRRLCEDSRRLKQLAEASKDYLQSNDKPLLTNWVPSIEEWLQYKAEDEFDNAFQLIIEQDVAVKINVYWLGTCIDNLLKNAIKYGTAPITMEVITKSNTLIIKVIDKGELSRKDWCHLKKPFVSKSGIGLGLTIVESMIKRMNGKMTLVGPPTTFILEIPCETDTASR